MIGDEEPVYPIGIAAKSLGVCAATLRIWEKKGLVKPARLGKDRYYSSLDMKRLKYIKWLLREKGINIAGVKDLLERSFCWDIKGCSEEERKECPVYKKWTADRDNLEGYQGSEK